MLHVDTSPIVAALYQEHGATVHTLDRRLAEAGPCSA